GNRSPRAGIVGNFKVWSDRQCCPVGRDQRSNLSPANARDLTRPTVENSCRGRCSDRGCASCFPIQTHVTAAESDGFQPHHERWTQQGADGYRWLEDLLLFLLRGMFPVSGVYEGR